RARLPPPSRRAPPNGAERIRARDSSRRRGGRSPDLESLRGAVRARSRSSLGRRATRGPSEARLAWALARRARSISFREERGLVERLRRLVCVTHPARLG